MAFGMFLRGVVAVVLGLMLGAAGLAQEVLQSAPQQDPAEKAWEILRNGAHVSNFEKRADAVQALGLTSGDPAAVQVAEAALQDKEADVRAAAVKALGAMGSTASIAKLENLLSDKDISVVLAAAHSLVQLKNKSGYDVYYSVLQGELKGGQGLFTKQMKEMKRPERAIKFAFDQGIGFLPYAGYGKEALHAWRERSTAPTRAAAARALADDPEPRTNRALAKAVYDKDWVVRAAALEAIAKRGDPVLLNDIEQAMYDKKDIVRFSAAAAVLHLTSIARGSGTRISDGPNGCVSVE
jgi:HEAT repeat protein